jgi:hypothetical protein
MLNSHHLQLKAFLKNQEEISNSYYCSDIEKPSPPVLSQLRVSLPYILFNWFWKAFSGVSNKNSWYYVDTITSLEVHFSQRRSELQSTRRTEKKKDDIAFWLELKMR